MLLALKKAAVAIVSVIPLIAGLFTGTNNFDTVPEYRANVGKVAQYQNTLDTAVPMTDVYRIITDFLNEPLPQGKTEKKVIVLGYDGCRADVLSRMQGAEQSGIRTLLADGGKLVLSYCGGVNYPNLATQKTSTAPGWCSMLTGKWGSVTGIKDNGQEKSNQHLTLLTTLVEDGTVDSSAFYVSWGGHFSGSGTTYWQERQYAEQKGLNETFLCSGDDNGTRDAVLRDVLRPDCSDIIMSIFEYCDHEGHDSGFNLRNGKYVNAFLSAEKTAKTCIDAIKSRSTYAQEDWLIIITSDHGGYNDDHGSHSIQERNIFIATNKDVAYSYPRNK